MHPAVTPIAAIFRLDTELFLNCLAGVDDAHAARRLTPDLNSIAFLAAHLVESRHWLAGLLGAPLELPFPEAFRRARSQDEAGALPGVAELAAHWHRISAHLAVQVERLDTPQLARDAHAFPGADGTLLGALAFLAHHESYHIGQMALLRRALGLPAMSYRLEPREPGRTGA